MHWIAYSFAFLAIAFAFIFLPRRGFRDIVYLLSNWASAAAMMVAAVEAMASGRVIGRLDVPLSILPSLDFVLDPLRGFLLLIAAIVYAASIAFVNVEARDSAPARARAICGLTVLLCGAIFGVILSAGVLSLIFTWELMSLLLWALVSLDYRQFAQTRAGLFALALSEAGSLAALAGLLILAQAAGTYELSGIAASASRFSPWVAWTGFVLTFAGFGVKTGILPVNVWMAGAYSAAPRSVAPIFSGATMNLGVFTLLVVDGPLAICHTNQGLLMLTVGAMTALIGIVYAMTERDMTRLLTQSSIENLGIVVAALGAGFAFAALGKPVAAGMALIAGLYHMMNHSAFKTLLFLGAGGIDRATGTRDMDRLGGVMRRLPLFGSLFLVGAMAISALPPFNGFVSEWLTLESLLRVVEVASVPVRITFALSGAALALTAGIALTCFTQLAGATLLGVARSPSAMSPRSPGMSITAPMAVLGVACLLLGLLATAIIPLLGLLVAPLAGTNAAPALVPAFFGAAHELPAVVAHDLTQIGARIGAGWIPLRGLVVLHSGGTATPVIFAMSTALSGCVILFIMTLVWFVARVLRRNRITKASLWDAGLTRLSPEMTYNATAFAAPVRVLFDTLLRPVVAERLESHGAFSTGQVRDTHLEHIVDRLTTRPLIRGLDRIAEWIAGMHHGRVTAYAGYVLCVLVAALLMARVLLH